MVSTSSTCERLSLRCIINRGCFVELFAVRLVSTSRRPNYRRNRLSFCLARLFSRFLCLPLHAASAMHDDATISFPRHFSILCCSFLDGPSFSTQKVFSMPASALDLALYAFFFFFLFVFVFLFLFFFLLHGVLAFSLSCLLLLFQFHKTVYLSGWTQTGDAEM